MSVWVLCVREDSEDQRTNFGGQLLSFAVYSRDGTPVIRLVWQTPTILLAQVIVFKLSTSLM